MSGVTPCTAPITPITPIAPAAPHDPTTRRGGRR
jgi:hypothetical protein